MKTYWAIEDKKGNLIFNFHLNGPILVSTEEEAKFLIDRKSDRPVKVEIRRVSDAD